MMLLMIELLSWWCFWWLSWLDDDLVGWLVDSAADEWLSWLVSWWCCWWFELFGWWCCCWWLSWLVDEQERLMKKLGANAYPFFFELPPHCPASVTLQPAPGDTGEVTVASSCNRSLRYGRSGCDSCYVEVFHFLSQKPHYRYPAYAIL